MVNRSCRSCCALLALLWGGFAAPVVAQDEGLDALLYVPFLEEGVTDVHASGFQIYRIPLSFPVRKVEEHPWGLRITFPVSLSSTRVEALGDVEEFVANLQTASVIPGVEVVVPVGGRWQLKPFAEIGIGAGSSEGDVEVLYGVGLRSSGGVPAGRVALTLGGAAAYKKPATSRARLDGYSRLEAGIDAQVPLGFDLGGGDARGGVYGIVRRFSNLDLERLGQEPIELRNQYELGISFSTDPALRLWKVKLPWIGLGYQFGDVVSGVRLYLAFPF